MLSLKAIKRSVAPGFHPRAIWHSLTTYRRFIGTIKPEFLALRDDEFQARLSSLHRCWTPIKLQVPLGRRVLVLAPHPDDEVIGPGGLLLAHRDKSEIHVITLFDGSGGGRLEDAPWEGDSEYRERLVAERRREQADVCQRLGVATLQYLTMEDGYSAAGMDDAGHLRTVIEEIRPDVVLLPWFLDHQRDHRVTNMLFAWSCSDLDCMVMGYEIWSLCQPNAIFDISPWLAEKSELISHYQTQTATVDYVSYARGLASTRAFQFPIAARRSGAVEAFFTLPCQDYCDLVVSFYGKPEALNPAVSMLI